MSKERRFFPAASNSWRTPLPQRRVPSNIVEGKPRPLAQRIPHARRKSISRDRNCRPSDAERVFLPDVRNPGSHSEPRGGEFPIQWAPRGRFLYPRRATRLAVQVATGRKGKELLPRIGGSVRPSGIA
jgi:hypothetical protein